MHEHADRDHSEPTILDPDIGEASGARDGNPLHEMPATRGAGQDVPAPGTWPTPQQFLDRLDSRTPEQRLDDAERLVGSLQRDSRCFVMNHEGQIPRLEAEIERLRGWIDRSDRMQRRAEDAEAKVARVEALRDRWLEDGENDNVTLEDVAGQLGAALAGPAEPARYEPARFEAPCGEAFYTNHDLVGHRLVCEACDAATADRSRCDMKCPPFCVGNHGKGAARG